MKRDRRTFVVITHPLAVLRGLAKKPHPCYSVTPPLLKERGPGGEVKVTGVGLLPSALRLSSGQALLRVCLALALALPGLALAQTYEIPASVVGSGGGTATSASYSLSGTVGQFAVGDVVTSTSYTHEPGFWPQAQALTVPQDTLRPAAPTGLVATAGDGKVDLDWNHNTEPDLKWYRAYRDTNAAGQNLAWLGYTLAGNNFWTDEPVQNNTTYYYWVSAVDSADNESDLSNMASATPGVFAPPTVTLLSPNGGEVWNEDARHIITWEATDNDLVTRIDLFYSENGGQNYEPIADALENDGWQSWQIPRTPTSSASVKIVAYDAQGLTAVDSSDNFFAIQDVETYVHATGALSHTIRNDGKTGSGLTTFSIDEPSLEFPPESGNHHLYLGQLLLLATNASEDTIATLPYGDNYHPTASIIRVGQQDRVVTSTSFRDKLGLGVDISQKTIAATDESWVIHAYKVENNSGQTYSNFHVAFFSDLDINDAARNLSGYDAGNRLAYMHDATGGWTSYAGIRLLDGDPRAFRRWTLGANLRVPQVVYTDLTTPGIDDPSGDAAADYRLAESAGPWTLAPKDSIKVTFALVAANGLAGLQTASQAAQDFWTSLQTSKPVAVTRPATAVKSASATLNGLVNPNGNPTTADFEWWDANSPGTVMIAPATTDPGSGTAEVAVTALLTGLSPSTTYHYQVVAENAGGPSTGEERVFTTPDQAGITVDNQVVTGTGTVNFPNTSAFLAFNYTVAPGEAVAEVMQFDFAPDGDMPEGFALFANAYWEINYTGGGTFTIAITFNLGMSGVNQGNTPSQFQLIRRATSADAWEAFAQGVALGDSTVTFEPIPTFSQFTVAKEADIQAPSTAIATISPVDLNTAGIIVKAVITDNVGVTQAGLQYILGGGGTYSSPVVMQLTGALADEWGATIPGAITFKGIAFRVLAADAAGNVDTSAIETIEVKFTDVDDLSTAIPGGAYSGAGGFPRDKWRLISVPATLIDNSVGATIGDNLVAASSDTTWRLYEYTHNTDNQWRPATQFAPDEAYWLQRRVGADHFDTGAGQSHDIGRFDIELQPGWNLVSNPYPFAVSVQLGSVDFWGPLTYGVAGEEWTEVIELRPWGGYAILNKTASKQVISLSGIPLPSAAKAMLAKEDQAAPPGWLLHLDVVGDTYADGLNRVGRLEGALEELDYFDHPEPPYIDGFVSLAMERPEWGAGRTRFTSDVRSLEEADGVWDLALYTRGEKGPITLSTELQGDLPPDHRIVLLDVLAREVHDLLTMERPLTITDYREEFPYHLKIVAGSAAYVENTTEEILAQLPENFALAQNYPNPFNPLTHLRYSLFRPARVNLAVYNLLGQEVVTLVDGWQDLGHYEVVWDGRNRFGHQVASGIYIAAYRAEGKIITRKMVMMK